MTNSCGADTPVRETLAARTNQKGTSAIGRAISLLIATLREIFEESAYQRFLARTQVKSSPAAYSDFLRETEAAKARRPKCC